MLVYRLLDSRVLRLPIFILLLSSFTGCSTTSLFGDESNETVPKEEFDRLLTKYEALKKSQTLQSATQNAEPPMSDLNAIEKDSQDLLRKLQRVHTPASKGESALSGATVATLKSKTSNNASIEEKRPIEIKAQVKSADYPNEMVEDHIKRVRQAESYVVQNKFAEALKMIKELEVSPISQIRVRAKFLLGETFFRQGEYDLAMQVYEEILRKYSFSGLVIKSLGRLIVCSEKLNIPQKKEKYYSILHDFFEQG